MSKEYIEREVVSEGIRKYYYKNPPNSSYQEGFDHGLDKAQRVILDAPVADVAPVRHGEWLNFYGDFSTAECELCAELYEVSPDESPQKEYFDAFKEFYRYCPNCGAKMDKEKV